MNRFTVIDLLFMDMSLLVGILLTRTSTRNDSTHMKLICEHNFPYSALFLFFYMPHEMCSLGFITNWIRDIITTIFITCFGIYSLL